MVVARSCETISHAVHLSIDMQNIFSSAGIWPTPWMDRVVPGIAVSSRTMRRARYLPASSHPFLQTTEPVAGSVTSRAGIARRSLGCRRALLILFRRSRVLSRLRQLSTSRAIPLFSQAPFNPFSRKRTSILSSYRDPRPMFACSRPSWMPSIAVFA